MSSPIFPLTPEQQASAEAHVAKEQYLQRMLVAFDQFVNVLTNGDPAETISSRAARAAERGQPWGIELSRLLDCVEYDHGAVAQAGDVARAEKGPPHRVGQILHIGFPILEPFGALQNCFHGTFITQAALREASGGLLNE